jgi:hypothetical protein
MSAAAFNNLVREFATDLSDSFPENEKDSLEVLFTLNENTPLPMQLFMEAASPYEEYIKNKDAELFENLKLPSMTETEGIDMKDIWKHLETDDQEVCWTYIQQLFFLGNATSSIPPSMMSMIEGIASSTIEKVQRGEMSAADASNPLTIMQELMKNKELMESIYSLEG